MTRCEHHIHAPDPDSLRCVRDVHEGSGHRYESSSVDDGHTASEQEAERTRG